MLDRTSPKVIQMLMQERKLAFQKRFGQNFLIDANIADAIVEAMDLSEQDQILEIGPGLGSLTQRLLPRAHRVIAVEIDRAMAKHLQEDFSDQSLEVILQDVLSMDLKDLPSNLKIVGNLPYYITSAIIMHFLESDLDFQSLTMMMQKEVALRLNATPGNKDYGVLSVIVQLLSEVEYLFSVSRHCFMPAPKVESAVVQLKPKMKQYPEVIALVKHAFASRRKTLMNNLSAAYGREASREALKKAGIEESLRAENLSVEDFVRLAECFKNEA